MFHFSGDRIWASNHAVLVTSQIDYRYIHRLRYTIDYVARSGIDVFVVLVDQFGFGSHDDPDMSNNGIITIPGFSLLVDNTQILAKAVCNTGKSSTVEMEDVANASHTHQSVMS